jgi:hypothetical protein
MYDVGNTVTLVRNTLEPVDPSSLRRKRVNGSGVIMKTAHISYKVKLLTDPFWYNPYTSASIIYSCYMRNSPPRTWPSLS